MIYSAKKQRCRYRELYDAPGFKSHPECALCARVYKPAISSREKISRILKRQLASEIPLKIEPITNLLNVHRQ
jgi:hypothetical protein